MRFFLPQSRKKARHIRESVILKQPLSKFDWFSSKAAVAAPVACPFIPGKLLLLFFFLLLSHFRLFTISPWARTTFRNSAHDLSHLASVIYVYMFTYISVSRRRKSSRPSLRMPTRPLNQLCTLGLHFVSIALQCNVTPVRVLCLAAFVLLWRPPLHDVAFTGRGSISISVSNTQSSYEQHW